MRVLFVAYYFDPDPSVSSRRMTYFAENWRTYRPQDEVGVVSTTAQTEQPNYLSEFHHVPSPKPSGLLKDPGLGWKKEIKRYFDSKRDQRYDLVFISGGPFLHFSLAKYFKRKWGSKVILDFRDPFANNPRFGNSKLKVLIKGAYQKSFLNMADGVTVANEGFVDLIKGVRNKKFLVVHNGFDEHKVKGIHADRGGNHLVHAGKYYIKYSPDPFLETIGQRTDVDFTHIGPLPELPLPKSGNVHHIAPMHYSALMEELGAYSAGLVIVQKPTESTTKVYDYIGTGLPLVLLSHEDTWVGNLAEELAPLKEFMVWERMTEQGVKRAMDESKNLPDRIPEELRLRFSRGSGLKKLMTWLENEILNG